MKTHECWKCGKKIKEYQIHHVDGNHENDNFNNKVYLCSKCYDIVQVFCDNCEKQKHCMVTFFVKCWEDKQTPPQYFSIKDPKDVIIKNKKNKKTTISCKMMISLNDNILSYKCLIGKIKELKKYPCIYQATADKGCAKDILPYFTEKLREDEEHRNLLKSFKELKKLIKG